MSALTQKRCIRMAPGTPALDPQASAGLLGQLNGWVVNNSNSAISRTFRFSNYYETIAFVNSLAWIAHAEDHHPDLEVGYNRCRVRYSTHSIGGLSENDFICAAKIDALLPT